MIRRIFELLILQKKKKKREREKKNTAGFIFLINLIYIPQIEHNI